MTAVNPLDASYRQRVPGSRLADPQGDRDLKRGGGFRRCCRSGGRCLLFILFQQTTNRVGRLSPAINPVLRAIDIHRAVMTGFLGVVSAEDLNEFSVSRTATVGDNNFIV